MTSAGDSYTYERSLENQKERTPYSAKKIMYAVDTNSSQYTNQIQFDLSSFANVTDGFLNLAEASIQIPVVITASVPTLATAGPVSLDNFVNHQLFDFFLVGIQLIFFTFL